MTIAQQIGRVSVNLETSGRAAEFVQGVKFLMIGRRGGAERLAEEAKATSRVVQFVEAAQSAGSISGSWGSSLALESLAAAFLSSLTGVSAFDALWPNMLQVPLRTSVVAVSANLSAGSTAEASVKPASRLSLSASELDAVKAAAFIAVSAELLKIGGA
jgi:hypothetical protein